MINLQAALAGVSFKSSNVVPSEKKYPHSFFGVGDFEVKLRKELITAIGFCSLAYSNIDSYCQAMTCFDESPSFEGGVQVTLSTIQ